MPLALALEVPPEVAGQIQPLRERYGHGPLLPPHLTLLYPFVPLVAESRVVTALGQALAEAGPIPVRLGEVRTLEPSRTIYLEVLDGGTLARLYQALIEPLSGLIASDRPEYARFAAQGYLPHLTLADEVSTATYRRALGELRGRRFDLSFTLARAILYRLNGHDWHPVTSFPLGGEGGPAAKHGRAEA